MFKTKTFWDPGREGGTCAPLVVMLVCCFQCVNCELSALSVIGMSARQSTQYHVHGAALAVDGDTSTFIETGAGDSQPWWRVDLGGEHCVGRIHVTLRGNTWGDDFIKSTVRAGNGVEYAENQQCSSSAKAEEFLDGAVIEFVCKPPLLAKYVNVDNSVFPEHTLISFAELTVEEYTAGECDEGPQRKSEKISMLNNGTQIANPNPLSTKVLTSLIRCASSCTKHDTSCTFFDYSRKSRECHLYTQTPSRLELIPNDEFAVYQFLK